MAVLLGIDTGGTFTDAVLYDEEHASGETGIIAKAKAPTTHHDLTVGVKNAIDAVFADSQHRPQDIALASLSTTLATNALVEGQGDRVGLVFVGFSENDLGRADLLRALDGDPVLRLEGGHTIHGDETTSLNEDGLRVWLGGEGKHVAAFAVASQFAVRNPAHELRVREIITEITNKPVTCSHELSAQLGGPQRALTTVLNARLIGLIERLIAGVGSLLKEIGLRAPVMIVRGDGTLMSTQMASKRPIETILSGPAASVVGAAHLVRRDDVMISDIGGTTTDLALVKGGSPKLNPEGAEVGGWRTLVEAIDIRTVGLGGDSEVHLRHDGPRWSLALGPRRAIPLFSMVDRFGGEAIAALERHSKKDRPAEEDGRFIVRLGAEPERLSGDQQRILNKFDGEWAPLDQLLTNRRDRAIIERLLAQGLVRMGCFTPTDAAIVLGLHKDYPKQAAHLGAALFARQRNRIGNAVFGTAEAAAEAVIDTLVRQSSRVILENALSADGFDGKALASSDLVEAGLAGHKGLLAAMLSLNLPIVGVGASAATYYPSIARRLNTEALVPGDADVANALGAVIGRITIRREMVITPSETGTFGVRGKDGFLEQATNKSTAINLGRQSVETALRREAEIAGAIDIALNIEVEEISAEIEGRTLLVEIRITGTANGRPRRTD